MRTYALINNSVVTSVLDFEESEFDLYVKMNHMVIDVTNLDPRPQVGWVLVGNTLQFPVGISDREKMEITLNKQKRLFGIALSSDAIDRIGARNKILNKNGTQVTTLLTQLMGVKGLLETGALGTARYSCIQLKAVYTEYADIFDYVVNEINVFENSFGL